MTVVLPIVNTFVALPISMSGVGVRETLMVRFLGDLCHVPQEQAVPISIIGFLCTVIFYGLLGGLVYLFFRAEVGAVPAHVEDVEGRMEAAELPAIERMKDDRCERAGAKTAASARGVVRGHHV